MAKLHSKTPVSVSSTHPQQEQKSSKISSFPVVTPPKTLQLTCPGIGGFTILDDKVTDGEDVGVSFFLEKGSIGRGRGEEACLLINEMNPDVEGKFVVQVYNTVLNDGRN
jgi:hypothetical protein